jgi:putative (di)nucleoside polyphosphate hydrolase
VSGTFFRAGVGAVVLDEARRILVLRRKGARDAAWQLPQGGLQADEEPLDALFRELREETRLARADVKVLQSTSDWLVYELPPEYRNAKVGRGQAQRWFLCTLAVPRSAVHPDGIEFEDVDWVTAQQLLARAVAFRVPLYKRLVAEFGL